MYMRCNGETGTIEFLVDSWLFEMVCCRIFLGIMGHIFRRYCAPRQLIHLLPVSVCRGSITWLSDINGLHMLWEDCYCNGTRDDADETLKLGVFISNNGNKAIRQVWRYCVIAAQLPRGRRCPRTRRRRLRLLLGRPWIILTLEGTKDTTYLHTHRASCISLHALT